MDLLIVGEIVNTHGIKGEVRVLSSTDFPGERFSPGSNLYMTKNKEEFEEVTVKTHRKHKNFNLIQFEKFDSINSVERLVGSILKVSEENLKELPEDEFYHHEIVGLMVLNEEGEKIGKVKEILSPGANDVWVIEREKKRDLLLPYIKDVILDVNISEGTIIVHVMEGLEDL